jgi:hypothetical protein
MSYQLRTGVNGETMDVSKLPLDTRIATAHRILSGVATQLVATLEEDMMSHRIQSRDEAPFSGPFASRLAQWAARDQEELAQTQKAHAQELWQQTVESTRARWGNDAVAEALKQLTASQRATIERLTGI